MYLDRILGSATRINVLHTLVSDPERPFVEKELAVKDFKRAWFDEKDYCEFFPLHAVYRKVN